MSKAAFLSALIAMAGITPAHAQNDPPAEQGSQEFDRLSPQAVSTESRRFVRGHARLSRIDELTRWVDPICPRVLNLPEAYGAFIVNRINTVAHRAGAPVSDAAGCDPNITIMFTTEPQAVLDDVRANRPEILGENISNRDALARMTRPIQAWYATATGTLDDIVTNEAMSEPHLVAGRGYQGGRLSRSAQSRFQHALIVVDQNQVAGAEIGPISDYVAMLALSEISEESWACGGNVTIMELFAADCAASPQTLTTPDRAFLQSLYAMD